MIDPGHSCFRDEILSAGERIGDLPGGSLLDAGMVKFGERLLSLNLEDWRLGDVLLCGPGEAGIGQEPITQYQKTLNKQAHLHRWWHVGMYDGLGHVLEAVPEINVVRTPVENWTAQKDAIHRLRLREIEIDQAAFTNIVADLSSQPYDINACMLLLAARAARSTIGLPKMKATYKGDAVICSVFVERILRHVAQRELFRDVEVTIPMDFATSEHFDSLPTFWVLRT